MVTFGSGVEMLVINIPINGNIRVPQGFVDSRPFQRLKNIAQLGNAAHQYPGATYSRKEHSLGCMDTADQIMDNMAKNARSANGHCSAMIPDPYVVLAAGAHDLGHGPFGHASESILKFYLGKTHEERTHDLIVEELDSFFRTKFGMDSELVAQIASGQETTWRGALFDNGIDVDKIDYLRRDAYHTGVNPGVDFDRLITHLVPVGDRIAVLSKAENYAEQFCSGRILMYSEVYWDKNTAANDVVLTEAIRKAIENPPEGLPQDSIETAHAIARMNDSQLKERVIAKVDGPYYDVLTSDDGRKQFKTPVEFRPGWMRKGLNGNVCTQKGITRCYLGKRDMRKLTSLFEDFERLPELQHDLSSTYDTEVLFFVPIPKKELFTDRSESGILIYDPDEDLVEDLYVRNPTLSSYHSYKWRQLYAPRLFVPPGDRKRVSESFGQSAVDDLLGSI